MQRARSRSRDRGDARGGFRDDRPRDDARRGADRAGDHHYSSNRTGDSRAGDYYPRAGDHYPSRAGGEYHGGGRFAGEMGHGHVSALDEFGREQDDQGALAEAARARERAAAEARARSAAANPALHKPWETSVALGAGSGGAAAAATGGAVAEDDEDAQLKAMLGFSGFDSTKGKPVADNKTSDARGAAQKVVIKQYRQCASVLPHITPPWHAAHDAARTRRFTFCNI